MLPTHLFDALIISIHVLAGLYFEAEVDDVFVQQAMHVVQTEPQREQTVVCVPNRSIVFHICGREFISYLMNEVVAAFDNIFRNNGAPFGYVVCLRLGLIVIHSKIYRPVGAIVGLQIRLGWIAKRVLR